MIPSDVELENWLADWRAGRATKNDIERNFMQDPKSHGKNITRLWRERLGVETEGVHPMVTENQRLRDLLEMNGIDPGA